NLWPFAPRKLLDGKSIEKHSPWASLVAQSLLTVFLGSVSVLGLVAPGTEFVPGSWVSLVAQSLPLALSRERLVFLGSVSVLGLVAPGTEFVPGSWVSLVAQSLPLALSSKGLVLSRLFSSFSVCSAGRVVALFSPPPSGGIPAAFSWVLGQ